MRECQYLSRMPNSNEVPICQLWRGKPADESIIVRCEEIIEQLEKLESEGLIQIDKFTDEEVAWEHQTRRNYRESKRLNRKQRNIESNRYEDCCRWAGRHDFTLPPSFRLEDGRSFTTVHLPDVMLMIYQDSSSHTNLTGVFPIFDEDLGEIITVEDYLNAIEREEDWEPASADLTYAIGKHGAIKDHLRKNPSRLGDVWVFFESEYSINDEYSEHSWKIDLVFKHESRVEFLLVEIKSSPDVDVVDKAFGQLLRYKPKFLEEKNLPNLVMEDIQLAVAVPRVPSPYEWVEKEYRIKLIEVSV